MRKFWKRKTAMLLIGVLSLSTICPVTEMWIMAAEDQKKVTRFMDCFQPMPIVEGLTEDCWGVSEVGPRDQGNGLEDRDMSAYSYWDGGIIKEGDTYYMFASRWGQEDGHWGGGSTGGWRSSVAVYATSDNFYGPYEDKGMIWPDYYGGAGHNVFPFEISEKDSLYAEGYRYAIAVSDVFGKNEMNGTVQVSKTLENGGDWVHLGKMNVEVNNFALSNVSIMVRPDGRYEAINRNGDIAVADSLNGSWQVKSTRLWWNVPGMPSENVEDPIIWYSDGLYHCIANKWDVKQAYYLTSTDGLNDWTLHEGAAYTPQETFMSYEDGTENNWTKLERPNVYIEDGTLKAMTFAVIDVEKEEDYGNDAHGSKIVIVPFDGKQLGEFANRRHTGLLPVADTTSQTWENEADKNYGGECFLQIQKDSEGESLGMGMLGEGDKPDSDYQYDCKIAFLKYDVSEYDFANTDKEVEEAYLTVTYLANKDGSAQNDSIRVALADSDWKEGNGIESENGNWGGEGVLTGNHQPKVYYDAENFENTSAVSESFATMEGLKEVRIDVTNLVKQFVQSELNKDYISFALNETEGENRLHIGSKEAGEGYAARLVIQMKENPESEKVLTEIKVTAPTKTEYEIGEAFDDAGMKVEATYSDGTTKDVTEQAQVTGFDSETAGEKTITVTYEGKTATFKVTVKEKEVPPAALENITVTAPTKTEYEIGEAFDDAGMKVEATYSDGTTRDVTEQAQVTGFDSETAGEKTITVTYEGKTATFKVTVKEKPQPPIDEVDKEELNKAIKAAEALKEEDYTEDTWKAFADALEAAKNVAKDKDAKQEEVKEAVKALEDAKDALKPAEEDPTPTENLFDDVRPGDWYYDEVFVVNEAELMTGLTDTHFGAQDTLVRAQFAVILHRIAGEPEAPEYTEKFKDVPDKQWYTDAIMWAASEGIITGYENGSKLFGTNDAITREQMATIMYRYANTLEDKEVTTDGKLDEFPDAGKVQKFAKEALAWCVEEGIIQGDKGNLNPQGSALRAECAAVVARFYHWVNAE